VTALVQALRHPGLCGWAFEHYMRIAPPDFVEDGAARPPRRAPRSAPTAQAVAKAGV
jgi:hypothetical protein